MEKHKVPRKYLDDPRVWVVGSDEAGTGALAGPVVVAACLAPKSWSLWCIKDSKQYAGEKDRFEALLELGRDPKVFLTTAWISREELDASGNIVTAVRQAHEDCIKRCLERQPNALVVVDGDHLKFDFDYMGLPKADRLIPVCSAASVRAKTDRDAYMRGLHKDYPNYGFAGHKGYDTANHRARIEEFGICSEHRQSFAPIKRFLKGLPLEKPGRQHFDTRRVTFGQVPQLAAAIRRFGGS